MSKYCVDRLEGDLAVCCGEKGEERIIPLSLLPAEIREQDWIIQQTDGSYRLDKELTQEKRKANIDLLRSLME